MPLHVLSAQRLPLGTKPELVSYCDPHDLIAVVTNDWDVLVYRINGQVAFSARRARPSEAEITALQWKYDGSVLAIAWSDGVYTLYSGENGKMLSQSFVRGPNRESKFHLGLAPAVAGNVEPAGSHVVRFAWTRHRIPTPVPHDAAKKRPESLAKDPQELSNGKSDTELKALASWITMLDPTDALPMLNALPSHGPIFTDNTVEAEKGNGSGDFVDILLICDSAGGVHILMDDTVTIGAFPALKNGARPLLHASHSDSPAHALIAHSHDDELRMSFVDLPVELLGSPLMHVIATNTKRVQSLMSYINSAVRCIQHDFATGLQFPTRLLSNFDEMLAEKQEGNAVTRLYHLAMTHQFTPMMLEWLVDILKETNLKRWDQAISSMYTNIQNHIFMNLLPALDRLSIASTTLRGLARFHAGTSMFDVSPELFTKVLDGIDSLCIVGQRMQLLIMTEHKRFKAFSKWLRVMIEVGVAGPGSKTALEAEEREVPNLDHASLLAYIKGTMTHSDLAVHVEQREGLAGNCSREDFFANDVMRHMNYDRTKDALEQLQTLGRSEKIKLKGVLDPEALVSLPAITVYLAGNVKVALDGITGWQSKMLATPLWQPVPIAVASTFFDMRLTPTQDPKADRNIISCLALHPGAPHELEIIRVPRPSVARGSIKPFVESLDLGVEYKIVDATFYGEDECMLLAYHLTRGYSLAHVQGTTDVAGSYTPSLLHYFPPEAFFSPKKVLVGGRKGRMVCVVFNDDGREWKIFNLASRVVGIDPMGSDQWVDDDDEMQMN